MNKYAPKITSFPNPHRGIICYYLDFFIQRFFLIFAKLLYAILK